MTALTSALDHGRASFLRKVLGFELARRIFVSRPRRLAVFFCASLVLNLTLALAFPIWMLLLGPLLFGMAHVYASIRYVPRALFDESLTAQKVTKWCAVAIFSVSLLRFAETSGRVSLPSIGLIDGWEYFSILGLYLAALAYKKVRPFKILVGATLLSPLAFASWHSPLYCAIFLLLFHNFVAFFYWHRAARQRYDRWVAHAALALFTLVNVALFLGAFDPLMHQLHGSLGAWQPRISLREILGAGILREIGDIDLIVRLLVAYAFGQSLHYVVWLKLIPEQSISQQIPLNFTQSKKHLLRDFGWALSLFAVLSVVAVWVLVPFTNLIWLRDMYLVASTAHGYLEIAGLPFMFMGRSHV